jgi:hypothetical protein
MESPFEWYPDIAEATAEPLQMDSVERNRYSGPFRRISTPSALAPALVAAKGRYGSPSSHPPPEARAGFDGVTC